MAVVGHGAALVAGLVAREESVRKVVNQLRDLLLLPLVLALIVVDRVLAAGEEFADGAALAVDLAGGFWGNGHGDSVEWDDHGPPRGQTPAG